MKDILKNVFKIVGVILVLCGVYLMIQTEFVSSVENGIMYDGLGQELNESGEQKVNRYVLPTYLFIGGGIGLFNVNFDKKNKQK
jgi:hypothetical protein